MIQAHPKLLTFDEFINWLPESRRAFYDDYLDGGEGKDYQEVETSPTFPLVWKTKLYEFLAQAQKDEVAAEQSLRQWVRQQQDFSSSAN